VLGHLLRQVSGTGDFSGGGTVYNEGDLRPGHSPAAISFGGKLVLGSSSSTNKAGTIADCGLRIAD
jgi:hypothetical protein